MDKQLIIVSGVGQRLMIHLHASVLTTVEAPADEYTYVLLEQTVKAKAVSAKPKTTGSAKLGGGKGPYMEPNPDIQASLVGGLPTGVNVFNLPSFKKFYGSITLADLAEEFEKTGPGSPTIFVLEPKNGG